MHEYGDYGGRLNSDATHIVCEHGHEFRTVLPPDRLHLLPPCPLCREQGHTVAWRVLGEPVATTEAQAPTTPIEDGDEVRACDEVAAILADDRQRAGEFVRRWHTQEEIDGRRHA